MNKVGILYYHRINEERADYNFTNVKPENFREHIEILNNKYDVISLNEIIDRTAFKHERNAIAITFDDGYQDVYNNAAPVLRKYEFPFTCFITTANIFTDEENWSDFVNRVAFEPNIYHEKCVLKWHNKSVTFQTDTMNGRFEFSNALRQIYKDTKHDEWRYITMKLCGWAGISLKARSSYSIMGKNEILSLRDQGATIGSHTVNHSYFSSLSNEEIKMEVYDSKKTLESIIGENVNYFSYPFGDCPKRARSILDSCGYRLTTTSNRGLVKEDSDPMYLPRISVKDYSHDDFERYLQMIFDEVK